MQGLVPRTGHIADYGGAFDPMHQLGPLARQGGCPELVLCWAESSARVKELGSGTSSAAALLGYADLIRRLPLHA
jgi:hypothetical protein